jgi:hypothetical protein
VRTPQSEDLCNQATLLVILATLLWSLTEERKGCWFSLEDGLHVLDELHPAGLNADVSVIPHAQQVDRAHDGSNRRVGGPGRGVRHVRPKNQRWFDVEVLETKKKETRFVRPYPNICWKLWQHTSTIKDTQLNEVKVLRLNLYSRHDLKTNANF